MSDLARELSVSEVTVRSDLRSLTDDGFIVRKRGGVFPSMHRDILDRQRVHIEAKNRIARAAAGLVADGDCIMVEAGTTTALVAKYLLGKRDVRIVTNSTLLFSYGRLNPLLTITLTGGTFRRETESMVGPVALRALESFNVKLAFVGTDGFTVERGMTTQLEEGAQIVRAMRERAEETWLLADSSKYGKTGFVTVLPLNGIDGIVSDADLPPEAEYALNEHSVRLLRA